MRRGIELLQRRLGIVLALGIVAWVVACNPDNAVPAPKNTTAVLHPGKRANATTDPVVTPIAAYGSRINVEDFSGFARIGAAITVAESLWGGAHADAGGKSRTFFTFGGSPFAAAIFVVSDGSVHSNSNSFCGATSADTITVFAGAACGSGDDGTITVDSLHLALLLQHELGHALGFGGETGHLQTAMTNNCVMNTDRGLFNNGPLCMHEIEFFKYAFGQRDSAPHQIENLLDPGVGGSIVASPSAPMLGDTIGLSIPTIYAFADGDDAASGGISTTGSDDFNWYSSLAGGATSAGPSFTLIPSSAGSVSVWARLVSQHSGNWIPEDADSIPLSVTVAGVPTPSGLAASSVDSTHAIISWTNGSGIVTAGGRTVVQIEADTSGASWVTVDSTVVTNTADTLSSLAKGMSYNVRIKHIHKGISGSWQTESDLFSTTGGDPVITSFFVASCSTFSTNKVFNDWILGWTKTGSTTGWTWEIYINNVNNPSTASLQTSGTTGTSNSSGTIDDWSQNPTPAYFYFWVRYTNGGSATAFEPLDANPLNVADESCGMAEDRR